MAGVAKYVGFPAAPTLAGARPSELEDDLEKMGVSLTRLISLCSHLTFTSRSLSSLGPRLHDTRPQCPLEVPCQPCHPTSSEQPPKKRSWSRRRGPILNTQSINSRHNSINIHNNTDPKGELSSLRNHLHLRPQRLKNGWWMSTHRMDRPRLSRRMSRLLILQRTTPPMARNRSHGTRSKGPSAIRSMTPSTNPVFDLKARLH